MLNGWKYSNTSVENSEHFSEKQNYDGGCTSYVIWHQDLIHSYSFLCCPISQLTIIQLYWPQQEICHFTSCLLFAFQRRLRVVKDRLCWACWMIWVAFLWWTARTGTATGVSTSIINQYFFTFKTFKVKAITHAKGVLKEFVITYDLRTPKMNISK